jgi:predicted DNA-binding transcriptional regulator AlpA
MIMNGEGAVMDYDFTLKFKFPEGDDGDELIERLGEAGCDDAVIGSGMPGRIALNFIREADSARTAILSALSDVKRVIPNASLIEVGPDFVGLSDVAELVGVSRQNIRKLMLNNASTFPPAVHDGSTSIWHLALILQWLEHKGSYNVAKNISDVACTAMQVNIVKEAELIPADFHKEMRQFVGLRSQPDFSNSTPA